jgi:hypothetical protein
VTVVFRAPPTLVGKWSSLSFKGFLSCVFFMLRSDLRGARGESKLCAS